MPRVRLVPIRLLVTGDRDWTDYDLIFRTINSIGPEDIEVLIHGDARGADSLANRAAASLRLKRLPFPAEWDRYGNSAGPIRNRQMLKEGKPSWVIAFHDTIKDSKGTKDMLAVAKEAGIRTDLITHKKPRLEK